MTNLLPGTQKCPGISYLVIVKGCGPASFEYMQRRDLKANRFCTFRQTPAKDLSKPALVPYVTPWRANETCGFRAAGLPRPGQGGNRDRHATAQQLGQDRDSERRGGGLAGKVGRVQAHSGKEVW